MPISDKQLAANRANAAKSTGPRTPEGKARSSRNARTHGFTASTFTVVRLEDLDEIARLKQDIVAVYKPVNSQELFALEQMAISQQTMLRAARLEAGLFTSCLQTALDDNDIPFSPMSPALAGDGDIEITRAQNRNYALGGGFDRMAKQGNSITLLLRYKAQSERLYRRAVAEFDRLKALRAELPNEAILDLQPEENGPAAAPRNEPDVGPAVPPARPLSSGICTRHNSPPKHETIPAAPAKKTGTIQPRRHSPPGSGVLPRRAKAGRGRLPRSRRTAPHHIAITSILHARQRCLRLRTVLQDVIGVCRAAQR